jgi:lipocalin-like protein
MTSVDRSLVGTFRLIAVEHVDGHGEVGEPFGPEPVGYMTYTAEGYMFVVMSRADRALFAAGDILGGTIEERAAAFGGASAFVGRYRTEGNVVTYDLVAATYPNWVGTTQVRTFEFDVDRLVLTTPMLLMDGVQRSATVTLQRL